MRKLKGFEKSLVYNISVFLTYLSLSTIRLLNYSGGVEMAFAVFVFFSLLIHLITAIIIDVKKKKIWNSLVVILLIIISFFGFDCYLNFVLKLVS